MGCEEGGGCGEVTCWEAGRKSGEENGSNPSDHRKKYRVQKI